MARKSEKPKRYRNLGWIEVVNLRPKDTSPSYAGKFLLNLDLVTKIHFREGTVSRADLYFVGDGSAVGDAPSGTRIECLEDANYSRLLIALKNAEIK
jgi:hypothetical protein